MYEKNNLFCNFKRKGGLVGVDDNKIFIIIGLEFIEFLFSGIFVFLERICLKFKFKI